MNFKLGLDRSEFELRAAFDKLSNIIWPLGYALIKIWKLTVAK